jgi:hypothetical protein
MSRLPLIRSVESFPNERRRTMSLPRRIGLLAVAVMLAAIGSGLAIAAGAAGVTLPFTGDGNTVAGCYSSGGALKLRTPSEPTCPKGFTGIEWNGAIT